MTEPDHSPCNPQATRRAASTRRAYDALLITRTVHARARPRADHHLDHQTFDNSFTTEIAEDGQGQIATFFESDGDNIINPDPTYFEVPIATPLPEDLNFLP